ncbi:hypothetical protein, partial [Gracilibacillus dipsosauri]|uniref:hypothetical protein n=1 Tax=Gracilibacillus dipsosauri TaxID=178340 RepID=UPI0024092440
MADVRSSEGKIIGGKRYCGKTTELIKKASDEHLYILCPNNDIARVIFKQAKKMGLDIPFPITISDLPLKSPHIKEVLIDEVEMVLQQIIGKRVVGMSTSYKMEELPSLRKEFNEIGKAIEESGLDIANILKGLKAIQREARKTTAALKELEEHKKDTNLLTIELEDENSVPKVYYKGEEITKKVRVKFEWHTKTDTPRFDNPKIEIEHAQFKDGKLHF